jgi:hypothetical protein
VGTLVVLLLLPLFSWRMQQPNPGKKMTASLPKTSVFPLSLVPTWARGNITAID